MSVAGADAARRFIVVCRHCNAEFLARNTWVGRMVQCPNCAGLVRIPPRPADGRAAKSEAPRPGPKQQFNFACPRCQSLLQSHTGMSGQVGQCPTCAGRFVIPQLDPRRGAPLPAERLDNDQQNPTPVHAYAASGQQAPLIRRGPDGSCMIECPRCQELCEVDADSCPACGVPFSTEGMPTTMGQAARSLGMASLVLGIIAALLGVPTTPWVVLLVAGPLSIGFGMMSWFRTGRERPMVTALIGMLLGTMAVIGAVVRVILKI